MASDALDNDLQAQLGPVPGTYEAPPGPAVRAQRKAGRHSSRASKAPHADEVVKFLGPVLGLVTLGLGLLLCGFNLEDPLVDTIMLDKEEANGIAEPLANILLRQKWFTQYGRELIGSTDYVKLAFALMLYLGRVVPAVQGRIRERPRRERHQQNAGISQPTASPNGYAGGASEFAPFGAYAAD